MAKTVIASPSLPRHPFLSPGTRAGDYVFVSGQVGAQDDQGKALTGIEAQTKQVLEKVKRAEREKQVLKTSANRTLGQKTAVKKASRESFLVRVSEEQSAKRSDR